MRNCPKAVWMFHYTRISVCQARKWPCCFDETNIHRNSAFLQGANLSCPATTCRMYRRPSNLLLALGGHYEGKNHSNIDRQNEMDSCIKWMRPSSLQDLGYTTVYYKYGALCLTFPQIHDKKKKTTLSATRNAKFWTTSLDLNAQSAHHAPLCGLFKHDCGVCCLCTLRKCAANYNTN